MITQTNGSPQFIGKQNLAKDTKTIEQQWKAWAATTIWGTNDYYQFKKINGNRDIFQPHLARLKSAMNRKDLQKYNPAMVTKDKYILDGQHRLQDALEEGKPFYFVIIDDVEIEGLVETILLNATNRPWQSEDYLRAHIAAGKRDYLILQDFASEYKLSPAICIMLLHGQYTNSKKVRQDFYDGNFKITDMAKAKRLASLISEVRRFSPRFAWTHRECIRALVALEEQIDPKLLIKQLDEYKVIIEPRVSKNDYLRQFEEILKRGGKNKDVHLAV